MTREVVRNLARRNLYVAQRYDLLAKLAADPPIQRLFARMAEDRRRYAGQIDADVEQAEDAPSQCPNAEIESGRNDDTRALLDFADDCASELISRYHQAIRDTAGEPVNGVLVQQFRRIQEDAKAIQAVHEAYKAER